MQVKEIFDKVNLKIQNSEAFSTSHNLKQNLSSEILSREIDTCSENIKVRITKEFEGWGPLEPLIEDKYISEIMMTSYDSIWFERDGEIHYFEDQFFTESSYINFLLRLCEKSQIKYDLDNPFASGSIDNLRLHIASPPITGNNSVALTIRKPTIHSSSFHEWAQGSLPEPLIGFVRSIIKKRKNILIVGATSSGKTTALNSLLSEISNNERCIIIEDTSEILVPNKVSLKLLTRIDSSSLLKPINQTQLVKESLRMRPDRLILGEVRSEEAKDLLLALSTGHKGSLSTLHASSPFEALMRLEMLIQMGAPQWNPNTVRKLIQSGLDYILCLKNIKGQRKVSGLFEVVGLEGEQFLLETHYQATTSR